MSGRRSSVQTHGRHNSGTIGGRFPGGSKTDPERGAGDVLVAKGVLTADHFTRALRIQSRLDEWRPLGVLLVELGWVEKTRVEDALRETRRSLSVEQILVSRGVLRPEQLTAVVEALKDRRGVDVAGHLVQEGTISERAYVEAFCEKNGLPFVDIDINLVDRAYVAKASVKYLTRNVLLPMSVQGGRLNVVAVEPLSPRVTQEVERIFGIPISVWIGEKSKIAGVLAIIDAEMEGKSSGAKAVQYKTLRRRDPEGFNVPSHTIGEFVDALHCRVGQVLCEAWNVPKALTNAIARHHDPALDPSDVLTALVQIADMMAAKIGASFTPDPNLKLIDRPAFAILQLDDVKVTGILIDLEDQRDTMMRVF